MLIKYQIPGSSSRLDQHQDGVYEEEESLDHPTQETQLNDSLIDSTKSLSCIPQTLEIQSNASTMPPPTKHRGNPSGTTKLQLALQTPLPAQSLEELALISGPPTPMEESERAGMFGSAPLDLQRGVAVTEEAVGLHVPDLITQF